MSILEFNEFVGFLNRFQEKNPKELILDVRIDEENIENSMILVSNLFRKEFEETYPDKDLDSTIDNYIIEKFI